MEPSVRPASSRRPVDSALHGAWDLELLAALANDRDRAELLRGVAAAAVNPTALGGAIAHVLRWEPLTELFVREGRIDRAHAPEGLAAVLEAMPLVALADASDVTA